MLGLIYSYDGLILSSLWIGLQFELVSANFWGKPLWQAKILKVRTDVKGGTSNLLLCYWSHSEHRVIEASLASFKDHSGEAAKETTKGVKKAFEEVQTSPEIYKIVSKSFTALNSNQTQEQLPAFAPLETLAATDNRRAPRPLPSSFFPKVTGSEFWDNHFIHHSRQT